MRWGGQGREELRPLRGEGDSDPGFGLHFKYIYFKIAQKTGSQHIVSTLWLVENTSSQVCVQILPQGDHLTVAVD